MLLLSHFSPRILLHRGFSYLHCRNPTEIEAAAAAAPPVAPVDPHPTQGEPTVEEAGVPHYEGVDGPGEGEPLDEREDPAP